jgi:hypothetical protein
LPLVVAANVCGVESEEVDVVVLLLWIAIVSLNPRLKASTILWLLREATSFRVDMRDDGFVSASFSGDVRA